MRLKVGLLVGARRAGGGAARPRAGAGSIQAMPLTARRAGRVGLAAVCLLLGTTAVGFGTSPSSGQSDRLQAVRVCGVRALDRRAGECTRDESGAPLLSSAFHCSARARAEPGERFAGRLLYDGEPFPTFGTSVGDKRRGVYVYVTAGPYPMPAAPGHASSGSARSRFASPSGAPDRSPRSSTCSPAGRLGRHPRELHGSASVTKAARPSGRPIRSRAALSSSVERASSRGSRSCARANPRSTGTSSCRCRLRQPDRDSTQTRSLPRGSGPAAGRSPVVYSP